MATYLIDLSVDQMQRRLSEALQIYVDAMRYPRGTEGLRASMWRDHMRRRGWKGVAAVQYGDNAPTSAGRPEAPSAAELGEAPLIGIAYGYSGAPDQWWQQQVLLGLQRSAMPADRVDALMRNYFELTELHIHPQAQGRGLGEALARRLLSSRAEEHVLLSTPEILGEGNRAWRLYRRMGFADVIRGYQFAGDPRPFAILGRSLPLEHDDLAR